MSGDLAPGSRISWLFEGRRQSSSPSAADRRRSRRPFVALRLSRIGDRKPRKTRHCERSEAIHVSLGVVRHWIATPASPVRNDDSSGYSRRPKAEACRRGWGFSGGGSGRAAQIQDVDGAVRRAGDEQIVARDGDARDRRIAGEACEARAVSKSHSRSVPSEEPESARRPSASSATEPTQSAAPPTSPPPCARRRRPRHGRVGSTASPPWAGGRTPRGG